MKTTWIRWDWLAGWMVFLVISFATAPTARGAGAPAVRACDLLALADVTGLLGTGFAARQDVALTGGPRSNCAFHKSGGSVVITLHQLIYDAAQYLQQEQAGMAQQRGVTVTPVAGLGTGAFYFQAPNIGATPGLFELHFGKGRRLVTLWVATGGRPDIPATQALARIAFARLQ